MGQSLELAHRAGEIWRRKGILGLLRRSSQFFREECIGAYLSLVPPFPPVNIDYTVGETTATFEISSASAFSSRLRRVREQVVKADLLEELRPHETFFDVGANVGTYSCLAATKISDGEVYAFEPETTNFDVLRRQARVQFENLHVFDVALSDENGTMSFNRVGKTDAGGGLHRLGGDDRDASESMTVATRRCDDLINERGISFPNVVKIDVEGSELRVLDGMRETLRDEACRLIYCEVHEADDESVERGIEVENALEPAGFNVECIHRRPETAHLKAVKQTDG